MSAAARRSRRVAVGRLAVQLAGLGLVAYAADVFQVRFWYAYLAAGLVVVWAGGRFIRPAGAGRGANRAIMAGSHRVLVTVMLVVASAMILFGLAAIVAFGLYQIQPPGATVQGLPGLPGLGLSGLGTTTVQNLATGLAGTGLGLLVLGAVIFLVARRLGSADARRLMLRDPRPPVLYLRSFGDDRLRLWTATLGRPSLVERFTLRRFDRFEEVLVRHLSRYGPVIAVNPPGTRLAPLGAARETIDSADWQSAVASRMAQSALIVFLAPPSRVTQGLQWELRAVAEHGQWDKALVVVPPVPAEQLQARWRAFGAACAGLWPFTVAGPLADPRALVLAFRYGRWNVITADRRTEWSYAAALDRALGGPRRLAPAAAGGPRPGGRWGPLTLPVAALIVLVAAVMAGAGTWYAVDQAPAAVLRPPGIPSRPRRYRPARPCGTARRHLRWHCSWPRPPSRRPRPPSPPPPPRPRDYGGRRGRAGPGRRPVPRRHRDPAGHQPVLPGDQRPGLRRVPGHAEPGQRADRAAVPGRVRVHPGFGRARHRHHHRARRAPGRRRDLYQPAAAAGRPGRRVVHELARDDVLRRQRRDLHHRGAADGYQASYQACSA